MLVVGTVCHAQDSVFTGGRGLITAEGPSGMFINPTSGTLPEGAFALQGCTASLPRGDGNLAVYTATATYGVTDWFELGGQYNNVSPNGDTHLDAYGAQTRVRLLQEEAVLPELSIGAYFYEGASVLTSLTGYAAAYKSLEIDKTGFVRAVGGHLGFRFVSLDSDVNEANGAIGYLGAEIELPRSVFIVGEVSAKDDLYDHTPFSLGLQVRHPDGFGFSVAAIQTGFEDHIGGFVGVGINFS